MCLQNFGLGFQSTVCEITWRSRLNEYDIRHIAKSLARDVQDMISGVGKATT